MLKRFTPTQPDGLATVFTLPDDYILGTEINIFVNGQLVSVQDDTSHPLGYFLDPIEKIFTFYEAPYVSDHLYVMYEVFYLQKLHFDNIDWTKKVRKVDFTSNVNKQVWKLESKKVEWNNKPTKITWETDSNKSEWDMTAKSIVFKYKSCSNQ